jgi:hypothetical protein
VEPGAVSVARLRIRAENVEKYLAAYAEWFLPVDQKRESGRKLLTVLTREHGDQYNIVFMWRYDDAWKKDYYCKYTKAFFEYHSHPTHNAFKSEGKYDAAMKAAAEEAVGGKTAILNVENVTGILAALPASCSDWVETLSAVEASRDVFYNINKSVFAPLVEAEDTSWYFDINLCKVRELQATPKASKEMLETGEKGQGPLCPGWNLSILERAGDLNWQP